MSEHNHDEIERQIMTTPLFGQTRNEGRNAMELADLKRHIRTLITLEETNAPVISCYLNLKAALAESGVAGYRSVFDQRVALLRKGMPREDRERFEEAMGRIEAFLATDLLPDSKGAAIFARGGAEPFFLPLQFQAPLPNWIVVDLVPNVYHLVELKDSYHRFVVLLMTEESARILEINLGAVTQETWAERPELRDRVGSGWTKEHYQHHREQQSNRFIQEKVRVLDHLMSAGGHSHLILAGLPEMRARMHQALPQHLAAKLIDAVPVSGRDSMPDIVTAAISSFVAHEELESQAAVRLLQRVIKNGGLAVAGTEVSLLSLKRAQVDVLVMATAYEPGPGWRCARCGGIAVKPEEPEVCPACREREMREVNLKEEMVRLAEQNGCKVEIVGDSDLLMQLGGVGCLLRYLPPECFYG